jgi:hypothetical protein
VRRRSAGCCGIDGQRQARPGSSPPLAEERAAVLDSYFEGIAVEPVAEGEGWWRIEALPPLFPPAGDYVIRSGSHKADHQPLRHPAPGSPVVTRQGRTEAAGRR